jgi:hypothetical protein
MDITTSGQINFVERRLHRIAAAYKANAELRWSRWSRRAGR